MGATEELKLRQLLRERRQFKRRDKGTEMQQNGANKGRSEDQRKCNLFCL